MAKRFIDTDMFRKPLVRGLQGRYKLLWIYLLCECDHAGVWDVELDVAGMRLGFDMDSAKCLEVLAGSVIPIDGGKKWWIPDFVRFQYGDLNAANRVHASVISVLNRYHNALQKEGAYMDLISPLQGAKDKDKDIDTRGKERANAPRKVLFSNSKYNDLSLLESALPELVSEGVKIDHYRKSIATWSDKKHELRTDRGWLATVREWTDRDRTSKELKLNTPIKGGWNPRS